MASEGPRSGATFTTDVNLDWGGGVDWTNPGNAASSDNNYATCVMVAQASKTLQVVNFGFSIPSGATINGILLELEGKTDSGNVSITAQCIKGGAGVGAAPSVGFTTTEAYKSWGGATSLFSTTWTPAEINAADFGFHVCTVSNAVTDTLSFDHMRITVYYTLSNFQQVIIL